MDFATRTPSIQRPTITDGSTIANAPTIRHCASPSANDNSKVDEEAITVPASSLIAITPMGNWGREKIKFPSDLTFGDGHASVVVTSYLSPPYRGLGSIYGWVTDSKVTWNSENPPSKETYIEGKRLESIVDRNIVNFDAKTISPEDTQFDIHNPDHHYHRIGRRRYVDLETYSGLYPHVDQGLVELSQAQDSSVTVKSSKGKEDGLSPALDAESIRPEDAKVNTTA